MNLSLFNRIHSTNRRPLGLNWRSSPAYVTAVVGLGAATDVLVYSLPVAVVPFQLAKLGYSDLSTRTGWLLFAYAGGLVLSTPPIAVLSEHYYARRTPLLFGLLALQVSLVMFMLAPNYAVLCLARVIQGISSSVVWIVGVALLCDTVPEEKVGQQLGFALTGMSVGMVAGPPIGGVLYQRFGFYAPFIFGVIIAGADLIGRLFVVEVKVAEKWKISNVDIMRSEVNTPTGVRVEDMPLSEVAESKEAQTGSSQVVNDSTHATGQPTRPAIQTRRMGTMAALGRLLRSPRALTACLNTFVFGLIFSAEDPTLPLRLWSVFGFDSQTVGVIYIAAVVPTFFSGPLAGWIGDKRGTKWVMVFCQVMAIPWFALLAVRGSLVLFIVCLSLGSFFVSAVVSPLMSDLASVSRDLDGVGYAHVYGAFNLSYSIATAVGPVIASQIYDRLSNGWTVLCIFWAACMLVSIIPTIAFAGTPRSSGAAQRDENDGVE